MSYLLYMKRSFTRSPRRHAVLFAVLTCAFLLPLLICIYRDSNAWGTRQYLLARSAGETYHIGNAAEVDVPYFEGIRGLSRVAATEWGPDDINVNVVCPLAWTAKLEQFQQAYPEAFKANVKMPPMGHYGNAEQEIGRVCVQLAMPDFKFMSGETLTLEGGMGQRP